MVAPTVGVGLGGFGTGIRCIELLIFIIQTAQQAHRLKAECERVKLVASTLKGAIDKNKAALEDQEAVTSLENSLEEVLIFVVKCKSQNILGRAWELKWRKRLPALINEMMMWIAIMDAGVSVRHITNCSLLCSHPA
jgi:hypothetical protein